MMEPVAWTRPEYIERLARGEVIGIGPKVSDGCSVALVRLSDAEARIAEITKWRDEWKDMATELKGLVEEWQARAEAAEALLKEAGKALEPFADDVVATWVDDHGWTDVAPARDYIKAWFGPSDFRAVRAIHHKIGVKDE